jgi:hypothetical protein
MFKQIMILGLLVIMCLGVPAFAQTDVCIPQFLDGVAGPFQWKTMLVLQNQEQNQAQVQVQFFNNNGMPLQQLTMSRRGQQGGQGPVNGNGQFNPQPIRARSGVAYRSQGEGGFQTGFARIQSQSRIRTHARLQLHDSTGNLISETNIIPGPQFRAGSFFADRSDGAGIGLALTNPSSAQSATCTLEIFNEEGDSLGITQVSVGPHSQIAQFIFQTFPNILEDDVALIKISCDNPICALALHLRGLSMTQIPIVVEDPD